MENTYKKGYSIQKIYIEFECDDHIIEEELQNKMENIDIFEPILDKFEVKVNIKNLKIETYRISFDVITTAYIKSGYYIEASYEAPEEFQGSTVVSTDKIPYKNDDFIEKEELKHQLLKSFHTHGLDCISKITDIYGSIVDDNKYFENLNSYTGIIY